MAESEPPSKRPRPGHGKIDRACIYAVVPARAGSKGVRGKNIKDFCGKPLMAWAIENGLKSKYITRTFVSTDSEEYRGIAKAHGAEVPFLRPAEISHDTATDYQLFEHFLKWMKENEPANKQPSLLVQLRPTAPCVTPEMVDSAIEKFLKHEDADFDSLRSVTPADHEPFNMYFLSPHGDDNERLTPIIPKAWHRERPEEEILEPQSVARQILPKIFWHNAYIDIMRPATILEQKCCMGKRCLSFHMAIEENTDIDTQEQWEAAEKRKRSILAATAKK